MFNANTTKQWKLYGLGLVVLLVGCSFAVWKFTQFSKGVPQTVNGDTTSTPLNSSQLTEVHDSLLAASEYINSNKINEASKILESLYNKYPDDPQVLKQYYELKLFQSKIDEAYEVLLRLLEIDVKDPEQHFNAGILANMLGNLDASISHFEHAEVLDSSNPKHPLYLAQVLIKKYEYEKAKAQLVRVTVLDDTIPEAWGTLAEIALLQNKIDIALQHIGKARKLDENGLRWKVVEAKILLRANRPDDALLLLGSLSNPQEKYSQGVVDVTGSCWAFKNDQLKAAEVHIDHLNHNPQAWKSAVAAARYYKIAGDIANAKKWAFYAEQIAPDGVDEVKRLAEQMREVVDGEIEKDRDSDGGGGSGG